MGTKQSVPISGYRLAAPPHPPLSRDSGRHAETILSGCWDGPLACLPHFPLLQGSLGGLHGLTGEWRKTIRKPPPTKKGLQSHTRGNMTIPSPQNEQVMYKILIPYNIEGIMFAPKWVSASALNMFNILVPIFSQNRLARSGTFYS